MAGEATQDWSLFRIEIPPSRIDAVVANPDALQVAYDLGILELLSIGLVVLSVCLVILGFGALYSVRRAAQHTAREVTADLLPAALADYLKKDGYAALQASLSNPEIVAAIQAAISRLGLEDMEKADELQP